MTQKPTTRRSQRLIAATVLLALTGVLAGCSSASGWDPTDLLDFLDTKKKLPGERKPVFPDGVPGLEQGVPKELYKSEVEKQQQEEAAQAAAAAAAPAAAADQPPQDQQAAPKTKQARGKKTKQPAAGAAPAQPADAATAEPDGEAQAADQGATPTPPPPKGKKVAHRKSTTTPPADSQSDPSQQPAQPAQSAQQAPGGFPAPLPSGSFTR